MSNRMADFLIKLAEDGAARASFEAAPELEAAQSGLTADEQAAILSTDDARVIALASAPIVGKILGGMQDEPEQMPILGKILGGMDEDRAPVVAKILGGMDEEPAPVVAKILGGFDDEAEVQPLAKCA